MESTEPQNEESTLLERHVQVFLAENLSVLKIPGLKLVRMEYPLPIGRVDILASTPDQDLYAIEIKRGAIERQDVGQVQSYMGALMEENPSAVIYGLLIGQELSAAAKHALAVTSRIGFVPFQVHFAFGKVPALLDRSSPWSARSPSVAAQASLEMRRCWKCHERVVPWDRKGSLRCPHCHNPM